MPSRGAGKARMRDMADQGGWARLLRWCTRQGKVLSAAARRPRSVPAVWRGTHSTSLAACRAELRQPRPRRRGRRHPCTAARRSPTLPWEPGWKPVLAHARSCHTQARVVGLGRFEVKPPQNFSLQRRLLGTWRVPCIFFILSKTPSHHDPILI